MRYLADQPNLNSKKTIWLGTLSEFDFEMRYINKKENKVVDALYRRVQVNHIPIVRYYGTD